MALARIYNRESNVDLVLGDDEKWTGEPLFIVHLLNREKELTPAKSTTPGDPICASAHAAHEFLLSCSKGYKLEMMYEPAPIPEGAMH